MAIKKPKAFYKGYSISALFNNVLNQVYKNIYYSIRAFILEINEDRYS